MGFYSAVYAGERGMFGRGIRPFRITANLFAVQVYLGTIVIKIIIIPTEKTSQSERPRTISRVPGTRPRFYGMKSARRPSR